MVLKISRSQVGRTEGQTDGRTTGISMSYPNFVCAGQLLSTAGPVILNTNRDYPSDSLSIQIKRIYIEIVFNVHIMGNNVNPDRKRFRYSGVDMANASHAQFSTKAMAMHCKKTPSFEVVVEHDSHYESGYLF